MTPVIIINVYKWPLNYISISYIFYYIYRNVA